MWRSLITWPDFKIDPLHRRIRFIPRYGRVTMLEKITGRRRSNQSFLIDRRVSFFPDVRTAVDPSQLTNHFPRLCRSGGPMQTLHHETEIQLSAANIDQRIG